jgi:ribosomal protein L37AE/L43A
VKASLRREIRKDAFRRRCPDCRNRLLRVMQFGPAILWCEACGKTGGLGAFPYQSFYAPKEGQ